MKICRRLLPTLTTMTKRECSKYYRVLDAAFSRFGESHGNGMPKMIVLSYDFDEFLDQEQIYFECPVVGWDLPRYSLLLHAEHAAVEA